MKIKSLAIVTLITSVVFLVSCSHQVGVIGVGTGFRVGGGEYGVSYGDGLFGTFVSKDGIHFKAELDSTQGFSFDPSTNSLKSTDTPSISARRIQKWRKPIMMLSSSIMRYRRSRTSHAPP